MGRGLYNGAGGYIRDYILSSITVDVKVKFKSMDLSTALSNIKISLRARAQKKLNLKGKRREKVGDILN